MLPKAYLVGKGVGLAVFEFKEGLDFRVFEWDSSSNSTGNQVDATVNLQEPLGNFSGYTRILVTWEADKDKHYLVWVFDEGVNSKE